MGATEEYAMRSALDGARFEAEQHAAALLEARAERDRLREALTGLERAGRIYHRELSRSEDDDYPEVADFLNALLAARSALSPESNPEGQ